VGAGSGGLGTSSSVQSTGRAPVFLY